MTARERLLSDEAKAKRVDNFLSTLLFDEVAEAALIEFMGMLGTAGNIELSAANNYRREGAMEVLRVLKTVAKPLPAPPEPISSVLKG